MSLGVDEGLVQGCLVTLSKGLECQVDVFFFFSRVVSSVWNTALPGSTWPHFVILDYT